MNTILSIKDLSKSFGKLKALDRISFDIEKGKIYGILGPNGSGKSTTLGIVLNVVNKSSGSFSWFGGELSHHEALKKVGAIIERPNFYPYMTARQNLELVCKIKEANTDKIDQILKSVHLFDRADSKFRTFSLGMKQRLAIASALVNEPEFLILDEPTNGLDPQGIHEIREIIKMIASKGTTILLASHLLDEVEKVCSDVVVIQKGKMLYNGPVKNMSSTHGIFSVSSNNLELLKTTLLSFPEIESVEEIDGKIEFKPSKLLEASDLNQRLFSKEIILDHLEKRNPSLEEEFLALTQDS
ncbi:MAG: ABC transporter ATP-binding protein [Flavobacteriaceae bacterium]